MLYFINFLEVWLIDKDSLDKKYVRFNDHKNPKYYKLQILCADSSVDPLEQERGELVLGAEFLCVVSSFYNGTSWHHDPSSRCSGAGACLLSQHRQVGFHSTEAVGAETIITLLCCHIIVIIVVGRNR